MNLDTFEKQQQEEVIGAEARGEAGVSFAHLEIDRLKHKIEKRKTRQKKLRSIFGTLLVIIVILIAGVAYSQYRLYVLSHEEKVTGDGKLPGTPKTGEEVVNALSRHILLPDGVPQIAEVQDVAKLKEKQAFFKDVELGDIVVVYTNTIILYRPSKDIIVAEGDISGVGQVQP